MVSRRRSPCHYVQITLAGDPLVLGSSAFAHFRQKRQTRGPGTKEAPMKLMFEYLLAGLVGALAQAIGMSAICYWRDRSGASGRDTHISSNPRTPGPDEGQWKWPKQ